MEKELFSELPEVKGDDYNKLFENIVPKSFEEFCDMFPTNFILQNIRASRRVPKLLLPAYRKTPQAAVWYYLINNKKP